MLRRQLDQPETRVWRLLDLLGLGLNLTTLILTPVRQLLRVIHSVDSVLLSKKEPYEHININNTYGKKILPCDICYYQTKDPSPASPCCYQRKPDPHLKSSSLLAQKRNLNNSPFLNKKSYQLAWQKKMMSMFLLGLETSSICECHVPMFKHLIWGWQRWLLSHTQ